MIEGSVRTPAMLAATTKGLAAADNRARFASRRPGADEGTTRPSANTPKT